VASREEVFLTSKLWNADHGRARQACERTLRDLGTGYLDLYLVHWPVTGAPGPEPAPALEATWREMGALARGGLARDVGVSNFSAAKMARLLRAPGGPPLSVCQVEAHPYFRNDGVLAFCRDRGVHVTAYAPLGSRDSARLLRRGEDGRSLLDDPAVLAAARAIGATPAQALLLWGLSRGTSVLPKSADPGRMAANLAVASMPRDPGGSAGEALAALSRLTHQRRMVDGAAFLSPRGPYRTLAQLWDE